MAHKLFTIAALTISLAAGGVAFAQQGSEESPNSAEADSMLSNPETMAGFYTDDTMATLRTPEEIRTAYDAMAPESQEMMVEECVNALAEDANQESQMLTDLCEQVQSY